MESKNQVQTISCGTCGSTFAACRVPECYTDADWQRDLRKYVSKGAKVDMAEHGKWQFGNCECDKKKGAKNQLEMF